MSRLSSVGSVSISDRIKVFDKSGKTRPGLPPATPPPKLPVSASPFGQAYLNNIPKVASQYSAKDPTSGRQSSRSSGSSTPSKNTPTSPTDPTSSFKAPVSPPSSIQAGASPRRSSSHQDKGPVVSPRRISQTSSTSSTKDGAGEQQQSGRQLGGGVISSKNVSGVSSRDLAPVTNGATQEQISNGVRKGSSSSTLSCEDVTDRAHFKLSATLSERTEKGSGKVTEEFLVNNPPSTNGLGVWSTTRTPSVTKLDEEDTFLIARKETNSITDSEELPSFSSSVTEDVELVLGGRQRFGVRSDDLEEQVEDMSQQVEMLLKVKTRLEAEISLIKREHKREMADKEDELEDARNSANKRVKVLEMQLEQEHDERLGFLRERHEMEGRVMSLKDALDHGHNEDQVRKLKKDLRKSKALLKDAQLLLDKQGSEGMNKLVLRQLKNQLEDSEFARTAALKARQNCELELSETQTQLEDVCRAKADLEEKSVKIGRERADLALQLRENEEEMQELIKKYKASVAAGSTDQITIQDQGVYIQELESQRNRAREQLAEMEQKVEHLKGESVSVAQHRRLELRLRELESKLELEKTGKVRLETQVARLKEMVEKLTKEAEGGRSRETAALDEAKKAVKQWREAREELGALQGREAEWGQKKQELEKQLEIGEVETLAVRNELKLAMRRIEDLQAAIQGEVDSETDLDDTHDSDEDTELFLSQARRRHMGGMSVTRFVPSNSTSISDNGRDSTNSKLDSEA